MSRRRRRIQRPHRNPSEVLDRLDMSAPLVPLRRADDPWWQSEQAWRETWRTGGVER